MKISRLPILLMALAAMLFTAILPACIKQRTTTAVPTTPAGYAAIVKETDSRMVAGASTNRFAANFWLRDVNLSGVVTGGIGTLVAPDAAIYCYHNGPGVGAVLQFSIDQAGTNRVTRKVIARERIDIPATTGVDDMWLVKLDSPVTGAVPLPIVDRWGFNRFDLPIAFDRTNDNVYVQEVRSAANSTKADKILLMCEVASQPQRKAFTSTVGADSSQSAFVIYQGRACFVGPIAWGWGWDGDSVFPWPNFGAVDATFYKPAIQTAADKLGVKVTFITIN